MELPFTLNETLFLGAAVASVVTATTMVFMSRRSESLALVTVNEQLKPPEPTSADPHAASNSTVLSEDMKEKLIKRHRMLHAIKMHRPQDGPIPNFGVSPVFQLTDKLITVHDQPVSQYEHDRECREHEVSYMKAGWMRSHLDIKVPFVSANFGADFQKSKKAVTANTATINRICDAVIQCQFQVDTALLSNSFTEKFSRHLTDTCQLELGDREKQAKFEEFFQYWGHAIATEIFLGGERREFRVSDANNVNYARDTSAGISGSVEAPVIPASGTIDAGMAAHNQDTQSNTSTRESVRFIGGKLELQSDDKLKEWKESLNTVELWEVVQRPWIRPIEEFLPAEKRKIVKQYDEGTRPFVGKWVHNYSTSIRRLRYQEISSSLISAEGKETTPFKVYEAQISEEDWKKGWRSIGQSYDPSKLLLIKMNPVWIMQQKALHNSTEMHKVSRRSSGLHSHSFHLLSGPEMDSLSIGHFFYQNNRLSPKNKNSSNPSVRPGLGCISQARLAPVAYGEKIGSFTDDDGRKMIIRKLIPIVEDGDGATVSVGAFWVSDSTKPDERRYGLRRDEIFIENEPQQEVR